jgi:hypothetical protein
MSGKPELVKGLKVLREIVMRTRFYLPSDTIPGELTPDLLFANQLADPASVFEPELTLQFLRIWQPTREQAIAELERITGVPHTHWHAAS